MEFNQIETRMEQKRSSEISCFENDIDMPQYDIPGQTGIPASSATDCQIKCKASTLCTNFIYFQQKCWLKEGYAEPNFREGYVWGPKNCST